MSFWHRVFLSLQVALVTADMAWKSTKNMKLGDERQFCFRFKYLETK